MKTHYQSRISELEGEIRNLTNAVAKAQSPASTLVKGIEEREREMKDLRRLLKDEESRRPEIVFEGLDEFARSRHH